MRSVLHRCGRFEIERLPHIPRRNFEMTRISGMIWGLGLFVVISQWASPASAWDHDDDDGYFKHRRRYCAPIGRPPLVRQPVFIPSPYAGPNYYPRGYAVPQPQAAQIPQGPIVPPPLPSSSFQQPYPAYPSELSVPAPAPPVASLPQEQPGPFVQNAVPLYPYVQVKDGNKVPAFAVQRNSRRCQSRSVPVSGQRLCASFRAAGFLPGHQSERWRHENSPQLRRV